MSRHFDVNTYSPLRRATPQKVKKPVNFLFVAPQAHSVTVCGDFNDWNPTSHPLKRMPDGAWMATIELAHGHHRYVFMVDNTPHLDPRAQGIARNDKNERVSLIAVS
ncbi:isoamylase early set domain-containing protein [Fontisphaera persica]|uniref:isoamylase early set domain-containing protein n=1 Tax=Fontisphaera persica TaxID=2974023 RepID=UPI0024BFAFCC|nr:isoamylase early set domain-containing protein [Fontisphaera persica]WCJ57887.1 isoamylase early set domain-containing protein [Fontisphaera persica]